VLIYPRPDIPVINVSGESRNRLAAVPVAIAGNLIVLVPPTLSPPSQRVGGQDGKIQNDFQEYANVD